MIRPSSLVALSFVSPLFVAVGCSFGSSHGGAVETNEAAADASPSADGAPEAMTEAGGEASDTGADAPACLEAGYSWATSGGGSSQGNLVHGVAVDASGDTWVSGTFVGSATWGGAHLTATDPTHAVTFFAKLDPTVHVLFARTIDSPESNVADPGGRIRVDAQGNAYVVGTFEGSATLDGVTVKQQDAMGAGAAFVFKVDPTGKALWGIASANQGGSDESGRDVAVDPSSGDVYLVGSYNGQAVFYDPGSPASGMPAATTTAATGGAEEAFVAKFSQSTMKWQWAKGWIGAGTDGGIAHAVALDASHSTLTVFGDVDTELTIEGKNVGAAGGTFVATLAEGDGHLVWLTDVDAGGSPALVHGATVDGAGNVYAAGEMHGTADFAAASGGAGVTASSPQGTDAFLVKYDAQGTPQWVRLGGGTGGITRADDVAFDGRDGIYTDGFTQDGLFGAIDYFHTGTLFVARYDTSGTVQWLTGDDDTADAGGTPAGGEGWGLAVASDGEVSFGGSFGGAPVSFGTDTVNPTGQDTGVVARLACN